MTDDTFPAIVPTRIEHMDFTVVATKPQEMEAAQLSLIQWAASKIAAETEELREAEAGLEIAMKAGWKHQAWERLVDKAARQVQFYTKIKAALDAGYYIVPPFPIDVFAIRTRRVKPDRKTTTQDWSARHEQSPQILPPGEGRYVSDDPEVWTRKIPAGDSGTGKEVTQYFAQEFLDVDFPFKLAKPAVLEETAKAMALKVFDQMGVLPARARSPDPIVCGQILHPVKPGYGERKAVTFFIAWWLDTRTL